jgi:hypothetical protein
MNIITWERKLKGLILNIINRETKIKIKIK